MTCDTCKYWGNGWKCRHEKIMDSIHPDLLLPKDDCLVYPAERSKDEFGHDYYFQVGPKFGCIHHESK